MDAHFPFNNLIVLSFNKYNGMEKMSDVPHYIWMEHPDTGIVHHVDIHQDVQFICCNLYWFTSCNKWIPCNSDGNVKTENRCTECILVGKRRDWEEHPRINLLILYKIPGSIDWNNHCIVGNYQYNNFWKKPKRLVFF